MLCSIAFSTVFLAILLHAGHCQFPTATDTIIVNATIVVNASQTFDCELVRYTPNPDILGNGGAGESQDAVFELEDGAILRNCIIGAEDGTEGSADGIHCTGGCTIENCWFENVGEDAITLYGLASDSVTYTIRGGGARNAEDKIIQFNGRGTATITDYYADTFVRFARTCGNCDNQYERHMVIDNLTAYNGEAGQYIAGINFNYNDSATITDLKLGGASAQEVNACKRFVGVTSGESTSNGTDADGTYCIYDPADITYLS
uniref:Probable pectate lyase F n=1 Tax=Ditylenchus dipsaci TaxID=166011 RepID=A0A915EJT4_9BILA